MVDNVAAIPRAVFPGDLSARSRSVRLYPPVPRKTIIGPAHTPLVAGGYQPVPSPSSWSPGLTPGFNSVVLRNGLLPFSQTVYEKHESWTTCND